MQTSVSQVGEKGGKELWGGETRAGCLHAVPARVSTGRKGTKWRSVRHPQLLRSRTSICTSGRPVLGPEQHTRTPWGPGMAGAARGLPGPSDSGTDPTLRGPSPRPTTSERQHSGYSQQGNSVPKHPGHAAGLWL